MSNKILVLLQSNVEGYIDLSSQYDYDTLVYIYKSRNFKEYVFNNTSDSKKYLLYEDGNIRTISSSKKYTLKI